MPDTSTSSGATPSKEAQKAVRSPSYPSMPLSEAIAAVRKIETEYRTAPVDRGEAAKLIGYAPASGPANKALADLASYGLVERAGKGELRVTHRAKAILYPDNDAERRFNLNAAAFDPQLFRELLERFKDVMPRPPESGIMTYLGRVGMNQNAVRPATKAFLKTIEYVEQEGAIESNSPDGPDAADSKVPKVEEPMFGGAKVGDLVQWESSGVLQFDKPRRVRALSDDGEWVFVEGSETGLPMSQVIVEERGAAAGNRAPPTLPLEPTRAQGGEVEWNRLKVDDETTVRLLVQGKLGAKQLGKLIRLLEAQKIVLEDDA